MGRIDWFTRFGESFQRGDVGWHVNVSLSLINSWFWGNENKIKQLTLCYGLRSLIGKLSPSDILREGEKIKASTGGTPCPF